MFFCFEQKKCYAYVLRMRLLANLGPSAGSGLFVFFLSLYLRLPNGICLGKNERKGGALISSKFKCDLMHIHVYNIENPGKSVHTYGERGALLLSRKKKS